MKNLTKIFCLFVLMLGLFLFAGCEITNEDKPDPEAEISKELTYASTVKNDYAENFKIYNYKDGYKLLHLIPDDTRYLVVPEGKSVPSDLEENITVVQLPVQNLLISSTPTTSLINAIGDLDKIKLTTTKQSTWYIEPVIENMKAGKLTYIGEYKAPDYEILEKNKPTISVFSTMLDSVPEVRAKLQELSIPVMLDYASNEAHPLARVEYTKLYGALIGTADEKINEVYNAQVKYVKEIEKVEKTGKTAAIFYITSKGALYVRNAGDYVTKMLTLAGGDYADPTYGEGKTGNTQTTFEDFYTKFADADFIIYIWSMGGKPANMDEFTAKNELLKDFKAVKENNVWCTTPDFFQIADTLGYMISDMNKMLNSNQDTPDLKYLFRLQK